MCLGIKKWLIRGGVILTGFMVFVVVALFVLHFVEQKITANRLAINMPNGINTLEKVKINDIYQWIKIRGKDKNNPILLYLHGGPGSPMIPISQMFQNKWEDYFTVVQWDQRGAGKTYYENDPNISSKTTFDQMVSDALEMTKYLEQRFKKEKIFILGHSWGSMMGIALVQENPELFYAYVGTGQVINVRENEEVGYEHCLQVAKELCNQEAVKELEVIAPYPDPVTGTANTKQWILRKWQNNFQLSFYTIPSKSAMIRTMIWQAFISPDYSLKETTYYLKDDLKLYPLLYKDMDTFDARKWGLEFKIPIIFIEGKEDWQVPSVLAEKFLNQIRAPKKEFIYIGNAGHAPMVEQPDEYAKVLIEKVRSLALY